MSKKMKLISFLVVPIIVLIVIAFINRQDIYNKFKEKQVEKVLPNATLNLLIIEPDFYNPLVSKNKYVQNISKIVFEGLTEIDDGLKAQPSLARLIQPDETLLSWEITLKDNVKFHNNEILTSDDVIFTVNKIKELGEESYYYYNVQNISRIDRFSDTKLVITLTSPDNFLPDKLVFPILSKKAYFGKDLFTTTGYIGTGPYKQVSLTDDMMSIRKFDKYRSDTNGNIEKINVKIVAKSRPGFELLKLGEIDIADTNTEVGAYGRSAYNSNKYVGSKFEGLIFNMAKPGLNEKSVRQAILLGINRDVIIENYLNGYGVSKDLPINPTSHLFNNDLLIYAYNPVRAQDLLTNSNWIIKHDIREKDLNQLSFSLLINSDNEKALEKANFIKDNLKEIGIGINVVPKVAGDYAVALANKEYDMAIGDWAISSYPEFLYKFDSNSADNIFGYHDDDYDYLVYISKKETLPGKLEEHFNKMQLKLEEDLPIAGLYFETSTVYYDKKITGEFKSNLYSIYGNIANTIVDETSDK